MEKAPTWKVHWVSPFKFILKAVDAMWINAKKAKQPWIFALCTNSWSWTNLYKLKVVIHRVALRNTVSSGKAEIRSKHVFTEPHLSKCVQQSLIIVVSDSASILNLSYHVADSTPGDTLGKWQIIVENWLLPQPYFPHQVASVHSSVPFICSFIPHQWCEMCWMKIK